jgi:hypothetical protein
MQSVWMNIVHHRFGTAWASQPNSMFIEALNIGIIEMVNMGLINVWRSQALFLKKADVQAAKYTYKQQRCTFVVILNLYLRL